MKGLTPRQSAFVREYLICLNATQAAIKAGYSAKTAKSCGQRLLTKADVAAAVKRGVEKREERLDLKADEVLRELVRIGMSDPAEAFRPDGKLKPIHEMPIELRRAISSVETEELFEGHGEERAQVGVTRKIKFWDKVRSLESLAKHLGLLRDKVEVSGPEGGALTVVVQTIGGEE